MIRVIVVILLYCIIPGHLLDAQPGREICIMYYNVENLFLPEDAPGPGDDDFTPEGNRRWNEYRYYRKIAGICKVILGVNRWSPPAIVCLSEIENARVLNDLVRHPLLSGCNYRYLHRDSPDHRGMDVGIIYRAGLLNCLDTSWIAVSDAAGRPLNTREMISAGFSARNDTLQVVACHWSSKYGGALETEKFRIQQAHALGRYADSVKEKSARRILVAGGDLNDATGSAPLILLEKVYLLREVTQGNGGSTYKYQGNWESIDHVLIGDHLASDAFSAEVVALPPLVEPDEKYTGIKPKRTYTGYRYNGGISDHLPLVIRFVPSAARAD